MVKYDSLDKVPGEIRSRLGNYFTNVGGDTFVIRNLPAEVTGGALARYSRASTGIQLTLVNEFLDDQGHPSAEKGSQLMDRVLNAFGDESVGELEGAHMGVENISQLLTKEIQDRRIGGSPIEQSTRYVRYDQRDSGGNWRYLRPREIMGSGLGDQFESVNDSAFEVYSEGVSRLKSHFESKLPRKDFSIEVMRGDDRVKAKENELSGDSEKRAFRNAYNFTIRCAALDVGRCVLPSSTLTHMGVFGNGRFYTGLISHLSSSPLLEANDRADKIRAELDQEIPTFVKGSRSQAERLGGIDLRMKSISEDTFATLKPEANLVSLAERGSPLDETVSSILFPYSEVSLPQIMGEVQKMGDGQKLDIFNSYVAERDSRRDRTGRGLESGYPFTFDLVGGFAEYRDLERHRMLTQQRQKLGTSLGFIMPPEMDEVGLSSEIEEVVGNMDNLNSQLRLSGLDSSSQYATLFNHRIRFMMGMNLREFQHLSELRTQPAGHFSYRNMVMEMTKKAISRDPWIEGALGFVDYSDPGNKISRANEQSRIAGKNISSGIEGDLDFD